MSLTPRENALLALNHQVPERIVDLRTDCNMLGTYLLLEKSPAQPGKPFGGDGLDWFGVMWRFEPTAGGPMPDPAYPPLMDDITEWRTQVKFPNLDDYDFKGQAEKDLNSPMYDPDKLNQIVVMSGPFERLLDLMGAVEALYSMAAEPEATREFFDAIIDYKIDLIDRLAEVYPIDLIDFHDDWGTQKNSFMSGDMWNELLREPMARVCSHCKEKGIHLQLHSCGKIDNLIPLMIDAGIEHWSSAQGMNDIERLVHEYGDRMTFFGCLDTPYVRKPGLTQEELDSYIADRIDKICPGGAVLPLGTSTVPGLAEALAKALADRQDFFQKPENRKLP